MSEGKIFHPQQGQTDCRLKTGYFKRVKNEFGLWVRSGQVGLTHIFHMIFLYKENNIYLPFRKSCNKLFDVKWITLNSPLISRMNSVKLINTYSIILKLYKSQQCLLKQNNTKISKTNIQVLFLHNINAPKYKTKLQMIYWITHLTKNKNI